MRKRRLSSFELDALVVVKVNVPVNISVSVDHCVSLVFSRFEVGGKAQICLEACKFGKMVVCFKVRRAGVSTCMTVYIAD